MRSGRALGVVVGPDIGLGTSSLQVLMLVTRDQRRGAEVFAATVAARLEEHGIDVTLRSLAPASGGERLGLRSLGESPLGLRTLLRVRREMRNSDLVVACGSTTLPASVLAGLRLETPVIYQNIGDPLYWADSPVRRARVRAMLRRTAAVAALTEGSAAILERHFRVPGHRIRVIHNARSSAAFRPPTAAERSCARRRFGLEDGEVVIALVGALSPEKRVDIAIAAVGQMVGPIRLVIAGEGPLRGELGRYAAATVPGRVSFLGRCTDVSQLFRAADALVLTSASEGMPGVLIEAGLSGLPVVATDVGFVRDVVVDGLTGVLVQPGDATAVSTAIWHVLREREALGASARAHCVAKFDLDRVVDDWADLVRNVGEMARNAS